MRKDRGQKGTIEVDDSQGLEWESACVRPAHPHELLKIFSWHHETRENMVNFFCCKKSAVANV